MSLPDWRIYYDDGSTFSNNEGEPGDAPALGVILLWQRNPGDLHHPAEKHLGLDWYWWRPDLGCWLSGDLPGMIDQAMHKGACHPKMGRVMRDKDFQDVLARANRDPDFWHDPNGG